MNLSVKLFRNLILLVIITILVSFTVYNFIFKIYEVDIIAYPDIVFADSSTEIQIFVKPVNALGWEVPFRRVRGNFRILEGSELVEIILKDEKAGLMVIRSKGIPGKVSFSIISEYSLFPSLIEINFLSKSV